MIHRLSSEGWVRLHQDGPRDACCAGRLVTELHNQLVFGGVDILAALLAGQGGGLDGLYLEYENAANPAAVTPPALDPKAGVEHYTALSGDRDYLRVPLRPDGRPEPSDARYRGNRIRFMAASGGAAGQHGLPFSHVAGSVPYGAALVRQGLTPADDVIYARVYFTDLEVLGANRQVGLSWAVTLLHPEDV